MKIALIVILVIAVGLLAYDDQNLRSEAKNLEKDRTTAMDASNLATGQVNGLNTKVSQLNQQISGLQYQNKNLKDAVNAAASSPATPAQPPVAANGTAPTSGMPATPATPATPGTPPAAQDPASSTQLVDSYSNALAIVEGKNGVGSGFICNMDGKTYVITNAHVLADNPEFKVTSIKGTVYNVGTSAVAVGRDLVKMEVTGAPKAFDIASSTDGTVKIGDAITVLGNPEGAGVVKPVEGKILGIGPDLIEVDAQFVPGNSGSPIIHQATGKVLGVATYTVERKVNNGGGGVQTEIRRFGYRIDGVKQWEQINWKAFYAQSAQLTSIETLSEDFAKMMHDTGSNGLNLDPSNYSSPALQRAIRSFVQAVKERGSNMSVADQKNLVESFISDLRSVSHGDIIAFNQTAAYDYFKREVADESSFRDDIYTGLTRALESVR